MGMASVGVVRAEAPVVTSATSTDLVLVQRVDSDTGQYSPRMITASNFLNTVPVGFTEGSVVFANSTGDLAEDNTNFFWNDSTNTLRVTNMDAGASGTAGTIDVFPSTASKGKLAFAAADSAGNTTTTITNASQAGARTYTIPDAGASAAFMMTQGAQTVVGAQTFSADMTVNANVLISTLGKGLQVKTGSNSRIGSATLSGGTVTVSNTSITAATKVFITTRALGTVAVAKAMAVTATVANTSFTITSADGTDTSVVDWMLVESIA